MKTNELVQITRIDRLSEGEFYSAANEMFESIWTRLHPPQVLLEELSSAVRGNVITPADAEIPECLTCGACCASLICVGVRPGEDGDSSDQWEIVSDSDDGLVVDVFLKRDPETLACTALDGVIGEQVACRIYESRPSMCHHFEAGSDRCHAIRRAYGLEPFMSLAEMSAAVQKLKAVPVRISASDVIRNAKIERDVDSGKLVISALVKAGTLEPIHTYDPDAETWRQFEFDGLTLDEAGELIRSRSKQLT